MSDMKCPFCQQKMIKHPFVSNTGIAAYSCSNKKCEIHDKYIISPIMELLDRTRKALEIAVDALKIAKNCCYDYSIESLAEDTLDKITTLEQKD